MNEYSNIKKDKQIWKFCFYGFFKNLKFFEPYLLIYLLGMNMSLFEIGLLFAVREGITYVFEVPSGIIADHYGKKKELLLCFIFYIVSFVFFFFGANIVVLLLAMVFFGLGEAFRSGTHKAMILGYLEHKGWFEHKGFVYGRTRSYSLLGSSISAFISIIFVLNLPAMRWIFLVCIVPYVIDFLLIASYPDYLDEKKDTERTIGAFWRASIDHLKEIRKNKKIRKIILSAATYDGVFKAIKDYIQPVLSTLVLAAGVGMVWGLAGDASLKVYLGVIYGVFYVCSSVVSKNVYKLCNKWSARSVFDKFFTLFGILMILLSLVIRWELMFVAIAIYFVLYLMMDARRPVFVDVSSDHMEKSQRVTILSIESQIRTLFMVVMAPLFGFIADTFSISVLFMGIGVVLVAVNRLFALKK